MQISLLFFAHFSLTFRTFINGFYIIDSIKSANLIMKHIFHLDNSITNVYILD